MELAALDAKITSERHLETQQRAKLQRITDLLYQLRDTPGIRWDRILKHTPNPDADVFDFFLNLRRSTSKNRLKAVPICHACRQFDRAENGTFLRCHVCEHSFHAGCLDPPMLKLPAKGFVWQCEKCDKNEDNGPEGESAVEEELPARRKRRASDVDQEERTRRQSKRASRGSTSRFDVYLHKKE
jgi:hypothetical protein